MKSDFEPIVIDFPAKTNIKIRPLFDMHVGSADFDEKRFLVFVNSVMSEPNTYIVTGGDLIDNGLKNSKTNIYEQTMRPRDQKRYCAELLKPLKDRILCGTSGNHEYRSVKESDDNPVYDIMSKLDLEDRYRENICFLFARIGGGDNSLTSADRPCYTIAVAHGAGGGQLIASGANKADKFAMAIDGLDVLITGHTHKPITFPDAKLVIDTQNKKITVKQFRCLVASSWLEYGGYPVRGLMTPVARVDEEVWLSGSGKSVRVLQ